MNHENVPGRGMTGAKVLGRSVTGWWGHSKGAVGPGKDLVPEWGGGPRGRGVKAFRGPQTLGNSDFCEGGGSHGEFEGGETCSALGFNRVALAVAQQTDGGPRGVQGDQLGGYRRDVGGP